jgi:hypothetical protein
VVTVNGREILGGDPFKDRGTGPPRRSLALVQASRRYGDAERDRWHRAEIGALFIGIRDRHTLGAEQSKYCASVDTAAGVTRVSARVSPATDDDTGKVTAV